MNKEIILTDDEIQKFREWLNFNIEGLTWQRRYETEFYELWNVIFSGDLSISQIFERLNYAVLEAKTGPLVAWFKWLTGKFICHLFVFHPLSVGTIASFLKKDVTTVALEIRNFLVESYPHLEEQLNNYLQISYSFVGNADICYQDMVKDLHLEPIASGTFDDDVMLSLEVTLYQEWNELLVKMKKIFTIKKIKLDRFKKTISLKNKVKIAFEIFAFILIGFIFTVMVKFANVKYTNYLVEKIKIYEPQFSWLDKTLTFKSTTQDISKEDFKLELTDDNEIQDVVTEKFDEEQRFEVESEVILTSWNGLPRDFGTADLERSVYEENVGASGYRDTSFGNSKIYRIIMKSVDTQNTRNALNELMARYQVTQVDNVKPGQDVPGGIYYNLYVEREYLKEFVAQVVEVDEAIIYEGQARVRFGMPGKNKVFIYVKKI